MAFSYTKLASVLIVCLAVVVPAAVEGLTCADIAKRVVPCVGFLMGGPGPSPGCCISLSTLVGSAWTLADKRKTCGCLKQTAGEITGLNLNNAAVLPGKCGFVFHYPISPNTDCSKVH